jgi:Spy/CpxP family protein refolding chaperone
MVSELLLPSLLLLFIAATFGAQHPGSDPLDAILVPPGWVMERQQELGLTEEQKTFLKTEMRQAQGRFTNLQWQLEDEMEKLVELVKQDRVDESQTLAQLDKILNLEREVKRLQIALQVKIKNILSPEQYAKIRELRGKPSPWKSKPSPREQ